MGCSLATRRSYIKFIAFVIIVTSATYFGAFIAFITFIVGRPNSLTITVIFEAVIAA
jgi:hypothetical protein